LLDAPLHSRPGFKLNCSGFYGSDAMLNLDIPCRFGIGVCRTVQAGQEFRGKLGAGLWFQAQGVGEHRLVGSEHALILRLALSANKQLWFVAVVELVGWTAAGAPAALSVSLPARRRHARPQRSTISP
jgi:hypothetical protein